MDRSKTSITLAVHTPLCDFPQVPSSPVPGVKDVPRASDLAVEKSLYNTRPTISMFFFIPVQP